MLILTLNFKNLQGNRKLQDSFVGTFIVNESVQKDSGVYTPLKKETVRRSVVLVPSLNAEEKKFP